MSRPARAKPTRSLRWSMLVEPEAAADDELHRLDQEFVVVVLAATGSTRATAAGVVGHALDVAGAVRLALPVRRDLPNALLVDPRALYPLRPARAGGEREQVALADQLLGTGLVEDDARVGEAAHARTRAGSARWP